MPSPAGMSDVHIGARKDFTGVQVYSVSNLQASWEFSRAGVMTFDIPIQNLRGLDREEPTFLKGKQARWTHYSLGRWGGNIEAVSITDGIATITCESWLALLRGHITDGLNELGTVTENGSIWPTFKRLIQASGSGITVHPTKFSGITSGSVEMSQLSAGQDLYESFLPMAVETLDRPQNSGLIPGGCDVNPLTREMSCDYIYGTDLSATVTLKDGTTNVSGTSWSDDLSDLINAVYVQGSYNDTTTYNYCTKSKYNNNKKKCQKAGGKWRTNTRSVVRQDIVSAKNSTSIFAFGERAFYKVDDNVHLNLHYLQIQADGELERRSLRERQMIQVNCVDTKLTDGTWLFANLPLGNVVGVQLGANATSGKMNILHKAFDATTGVLTVTGEGLVV